MVKKLFFSKKDERIEIFSNFAAAKMNGVWRSWLAYLHGVQGVGSSSLLTPTFKRERQSERVAFSVLKFSLPVKMLCILYLQNKKGPHFHAGHLHERSLVISEQH